MIAGHEIAADDIIYFPFEFSNYNPM